MKAIRVLLGALLSCATAGAQSPPDLAARIAAHRTPPLDTGHPELVSFPSGSLTLKGFLFKPAGTGPFPAILWNHGSEKLPGSQPELAAFYTAHGFVFFIPHRHGQGRSPGEYIGDLEKGMKTAVHLQEVYNADVGAAAIWLRAQSFIDPNRVVMSGVSYGGIQTILSAEKGMGIRAFVPFAPAAMSWANTDLRERLLRAVKNAQAPVFLLQARNDYSIGPSEMLGPEIRKKGPPNEAKVYPAFGATNQEGHYAFATWDLGTEIWGDDVLAFISAVLK